MDWQSIAGPNETEDEDEEEVVEKPKPVKIPVTEVLKRAGKPHIKKGSLSPKRVNKKGNVFFSMLYLTQLLMLFYYFCYSVMTSF